MGWEWDEMRQGSGMGWDEMRSDRIRLDEIG